MILHWYRPTDEYFTFDYDKSIRPIFYDVSSLMSYKLKEQRMKKKKQTKYDLSIYTNFYIAMTCWLKIQHSNH